MSGNDERPKNTLRPIIRAMDDIIRDAERVYDYLLNENMLIDARMTLNFLNAMIPLLGVMGTVEYIHRVARVVLWMIEIGDGRDVR
jgi:hypothetical protein